MNVYFKNINYCYVAYHDDEFQFIEYVSDTMSDLAKELEINISAISRFMSRDNAHHRGGIRCERIKIHDYCVVVYKKGKEDFDNIVFITRSFDFVARKYNINQYLMNKLTKFFFYPCTYKFRVDSTKEYFNLNDKYSIGFIDVMDLDGDDLQKVECKLLGIPIEKIQERLSK